MLAWSEHKIARLRAQISTGSANVFHRAIAQTKLLALDGDYEAARALLVRTAATLADCDAHSQQREELVVSAIIANQIELAKSLICPRIMRGISLDVTVEQHSARPSTAVGWEIIRRGKCRFLFDPKIFRLDHTEMFISRWLRTLPLCFHYVRSRQVELGKISLNLDDQGTVPGLAFCDNRESSFLIPDPVYLQSRAYEGIRDFFSENNVPWEQRASVAFWRGGTSGRREERELGWRSLPRIKLCEISAQHPTLIDAAITVVSQMDLASERELRSSGLVRAYVPPTEIIKSKYQIDIDGNTNAWAGLFQKLLSGSPVLKVASPNQYRQWYYDRLKPWINYVPVEPDLSDLVEKVTWLRTHDSSAQEIGQRGRALALSLDYAGELRRSVRTISSALRHFSGRAAYHLEFGLGKPDNKCLQSGWLVAEKDAAWAIGFESRLDIPRPFYPGDYLLDLDLTAWPQASPSRRLTVAVNGEVVQQIGVVGRQVVRCPIPQQAVAAGEMLQIMLLHPELVRMASPTTPLDERVVGTKLHRATLLTLGRAGQVLTTSTPPRREGTEPAPEAHVQASRPRSRQAMVMSAIHGHDVWNGFVPSRPRQDPIQGWNGIHPAFKSLLGEVSNHTFVDVGAWKGQATVFVAGLMQHAKLDGCVIAVDTFLGSAAQWNAKREWFGRSRGRPDLYETFLENVFYNNLTHLVVPLPQSSLAAAAILSNRSLKAGIVHIDGSPDCEDVLRDAEAYWPLIEPGGYLVGDDYHETWPSVMRAAQEFVKNHGGTLVLHTPKWMVRKPG